MLISPYAKADSLSLLQSLFTLQLSNPLWLTFFQQSRMLQPLRGFISYFLFLEFMPNYLFPPQWLQKSFSSSELCLTMASSRYFGEEQPYRDTLFWHTLPAVCALRASWARDCICIFAFCNARWIFRPGICLIAFWAHLYCWPLQHPVAVSSTV